MTTSELLQSYVPDQDTIPERWEDGRSFLNDRINKIAGAINVREIGWFLDEELLSGKQFFPSASNPQQNRSILRKVIDFGSLSIGVNSVAHGVNVSASFSLIDLWGAATDTIALTGSPINEPNISYDATNIIITATAAFDRCYAVFEYIQEV